ncbi:hypothetical protein [Desulfogranum marinum]|nr:hypothetical protein [Desulfogranum marinum]MBM9513374.1 hypothetical protein [Desulfogranum marinum]
MLDQNIEVRLTASLGVATFRKDARDIDALLAAADQTLFSIKGHMLAV